MMENNKMKETVEKIMYAGVGATVIAAEKMQTVVEELAEKGKIACQENKIRNEQLKHNIKEHVKAAVNVTVVNNDITTEDIVAKMDTMSEKEINVIKAKLATMENKASE